MSNELHTKFFELSSEIEALSEKKQKLQEELDVIMTDLKVGTYLQDPNDLTVFRVIEPKGGYIYYKKVDYQRTKRDGEARGELSVKDAEAAGFTVPKTTGKSKE